MSKITNKFRDAVPDRDIDGVVKHALALIIPLLSVGLLKVAVDYLTTNAITSGAIDYVSFDQFWMIRSLALYAIAYSVFSYLLGKNLEIDQRKLAWVVWLGFLSICVGLYDAAFAVPSTLDTTAASVILTASAIFSLISYRYLLAVQDKKEMVRSERSVRLKSKQEQNSPVQLDQEIDDEAFYKAALDEYEEDEMVPETWAKALSLCSGVKEKAKWKYVELRVAYLTDVERRKFTHARFEQKQKLSELPHKANANNDHANPLRTKTEQTFPKQIPPPTEAYALILVTLGGVAVFFVLFFLSNIS